MILLDFSQILFSNVFYNKTSNFIIDEQGNRIKNENPKCIPEDLFRHMTLNLIRTYRSKFKNEFGELVLCLDNRYYWRREFFPYYKWKRKQARDESGLDWDSIFVTWNKVKTELKENLPYKVIDVPFAEADDIIGTLSQSYGNTEKTLIVSSDKDFGQLLKYDKVKQYSPKVKSFIKIKDPVLFLKQQIIGGDSGDGVPNILSDDDSIAALDKRQSRMGDKKIDEWSKLDPKEFCTDDKIRNNFNRNQTLIDLNEIPEDIKESILEEYKNIFVQNRTKIMDYFIEHRLKMLMEYITEF